MFTQAEPVPAIVHGQKAWRYTCDLCGDWYTWERKEHWEFIAFHMNQCEG